MARASALVVAAFCAAITTEAHAAAPRAEWTTILTPRFRIHYHEGLAPEARRLASYAEDVLDALVRILQHHPETPIHVVITDETDTANGFAFVLPENMINLYPAVPDSLGTLGDYDDFMRLLFIHELTHIVHLDTIGGIAVGINSIFGKILAPNQIQPRWFIEGVAVYAESRLTGAGRVRSSLIDMYLREDVLADRFLKIDELTTQVRRFPGGGIQWDYGGRFVDFIARHYGEGAVAQISHEYGTRIIPYALNLTANHATGKTYVDIWEEWKSEEEEKTLAVLEKIAAEGVIEGEKFDWPAEEIYHPTFGPNGELAFHEAPRDEEAQLVILDRDHKKQTYRTTGGSGAFTPDGKQWVGVIVDAYRQRFQYADLEVIELETGERRRRSWGARLEEPHISNDRTIVAVHQELGRTELVLLPLDGDGPAEVLYSPKEGQQIFAPHFSPDGTKIAAALHLREGGRHIVVIDRESGELTELTHTRSRDIDPIWSPDGRRIYFASDRGGVYNIHAVDVETQEVTRLTNVATGALEPSIHPDGRTLAYTFGVYGGWELRFLDLQTSKTLPADPEELRPIITSSVVASAHAEERYAPWETLLPKTWSPNVGLSSEGSVIGVALSGSDAVGEHFYRLNVDYTTDNDRLSYNFSYSNRSLPTPFYVSSALFNTVRPGSFASTTGRDRPETIFRIRSGIDIPLDRWDAGHGFSFSYGVELRRGARIYSDDPMQPSPSPGDADSTFASFGFSWRFSNLRAFSDSISISRGHAFSLGTEIQDPKLGSDFRIITMSASWNAYYTMPWLDHHVFATRFAFGGAAGDSRGRSVYVLGGLEPRNIFADIVDGVSAHADVLRGYPPAAIRGSSFYVLSAEYRFPIFALERGVYTLPVYFDRVHGAFFMDAGDTPADKLTLDSVRIGLGGELRADFAIGYFLPLTARLGVARGISEAGITSWFLVLGGLF